MHPKLDIKLVTSGIFRNMAEIKPLEVPIFQGIFQNSKPRRTLYILLDLNTLLSELRGRNAVAVPGALRVISELTRSDGNIITKPKRKT